MQKVAGGRSGWCRVALTTVVACLALSSSGCLTMRVWDDPVRGPHREDPYRVVGVWSDQQGTVWIQFVALMHGDYPSAYDDRSFVIRADEVAALPSNAAAAGSQEIVAPEEDVRRWMKRGYSGDRVFVGQPIHLAGASFVATPPGALVPIPGTDGVRLRVTLVPLDFGPSGSLPLKIALTPLSVIGDVALLPVYLLVDGVALALRSR